MSTARIQTAHFVCGPYAFTSTLPVIGRSDDAPEWTAAVYGSSLNGRYSTLEHAMLAAIQARALNKAATKDPGGPIAEIEGPQKETVAC